MTDRELLELAAKAAGMEHMRWSGPSGMARMLDPSRPESTGSIGPDWNPLTDDGDALRLAVKLGIDVEQGQLGTHDGIPAAVAHYAIKTASGVTRWEGIGEIHGSDPCAATRRAIVRAAAEIARSAA